MHPAPSVILFTVLSGLGFGLLIWLGLSGPVGGAVPEGWPAFFLWGLGYLLAVAGLMASAFHLGNPQRALLAFTQWRSSWLSREAWAACAALLAFAPQALSDWLGLEFGSGFGLAGALLALAGLVCTAMIYAQLRTVPRWNHWLVPVLFLSFALAGGAVLLGQGVVASCLCGILALVMAAQFRIGDGLFAARGQSLAKATGLAGEITVFEQPHSGANYLMREMIFVVGRRHAQKLRLIALIFAALLPALICLLLPALPAAILGGACHIAGALAARWLFFAEAEHVVGLYYGLR